ncbi:MAG: hypothetical protein ACFFDH_03100 [Promethearchaeota archaeon]
MDEIGESSEMNEKQRITFFLQSLKKINAKLFYLLDIEEYYLTCFIADKKEKHYNLFFLLEMVLFIIFTLYLLFYILFLDSIYWSIRSENYWLAFIFGILVFGPTYLPLYLMLRINKIIIRKFNYKILHYLMNKKRFLKYSHQLNFFFNNYVILNNVENSALGKRCKSEIEVIEKKIRDYNSILRPVFYYVRNFEILAIVSIFLAILNFYPGIDIRPEPFVSIFIALIIVIIIYINSLIRTFFLFTTGGDYSKRDEVILINSFADRASNSKRIRKELERDLEELRDVLPFLLKKRFYFNEEEQKL